jgi:hypothetical protein
MAELRERVSRRRLLGLLLVLAFAPADRAPARPFSTATADAIWSAI